MAGFTTAQLAALERAIALGVRVVEHGNNRTEYQSLEQMLTLRDRMSNEINAASAAPGAPVPCMTRPTFYQRG